MKRDQAILDIVEQCVIYGYEMGRSGADRTQTLDAALTIARRMLGQAEA